MHLTSVPAISAVTRSRISALLAVGATCVLSGTAAQAQSFHLQKGQLLVDQITAQQSQGVFSGDVNGATVLLNRYGGSWESNTNPSFIRFFNQATNTYAANLTKCAPLVTHLLKYCYGWSWKQYGIPNPLNNGAIVFKNSPESYLYVSAIKHQIGFSQRILNIHDMQPGDIAARWEVGTDTGHTMLIAEIDFASAKAYPVTSTDPNFLPALAGSTYLQVTVLDSTSSDHSFDTRVVTYNGSTSFYAGVGEGVMGVFVNGSGEIIAHTWSLPSSSYTKISNGVLVVNPTWLSSIKSRVKMQNTVELVVGRLPALVPVVP